MADELVNKIRQENYILEIYKKTNNPKYIEATKEIVEFIKDIFRSIEPSHYNGKLVVFRDFSNNIAFFSDNKENFYDRGILSNNYKNLIFKINNKEDEFPVFWNNKEEKYINNLLETSTNFLAYVFEDKQEYFIVNKQKINIINKFRCPSIFALQYHYLEEALNDYKNERVKNVSCELLKKCWNEEKYIYFNNKPEACLQVSLSEYLKSNLRGVNVNREFNLGASKPVDVRVFWKEANRAALIELKWFGQSLNEKGRIGTSYSNSRANVGMQQIKGYIDLDNSDNPTVITKGYLVVIDGRRRSVKSEKISKISKENGMYYANKELEIDSDKQYWKSFPNIDKPIRMFVEPICEI